MMGLTWPRPRSMSAFGGDGGEMTPERSEKEASTSGRLSSRQFVSDNAPDKGDRLLRAGAHDERDAEIPSSLERALMIFLLTRIIVVSMVSSVPGERPAHGGAREHENNAEVSRPRPRIGSDIGARRQVGAGRGRAVAP